MYRETEDREMEAIALLLAAAGVVTAFALKSLPSKDRAGITFLAAVIIAFVLFVTASDTWVLGESWVVFAAVPLVAAPRSALQAQGASRVVLE